MRLKNRLNQNDELEFSDDDEETYDKFAECKQNYNFALSSPVGTC